MGHIYKITNKVNQKIYIGKTIETPEQRWKDHVWEALYDGNRSNSLLHKAIIKYGEDAFTVESLGEFPDKELSEKEKEYIKICNSHYSTELGNNISWGGEGTTRYSDGEILALWEQDYNGTQIAKELNANVTTICLRLKALVGENAAQQRRTEKKRKSVCQYELNGQFIKLWESGVLAEDTLQLPRGSVNRCCNYLRTYAGSWLWKFSSDTTSVITLMENYARSTQCRSVDLISKNGEILKTYSSARQAEQELNLPRGKVSEVCNGKRPKTGNCLFQWNYPTKRRLINEKIK